MSSTRAEQLTMWHISSRWWRAGSKADISNSEKKGGETALSEAVAFSATLSQFVGPCSDGRFFSRSYAAQQHLCWGSFARSFHHIQGGIVWQSLARAWLLEILVFFSGSCPFPSYFSIPRSQFFASALGNREGALDTITAEVCLHTFSLAVCESSYYQKCDTLILCQDFARTAQSRL